MKNITVRKDELIRILKSNRDTHRQVFEEAIEGYRKAVIEELGKRIEAAKAGKDRNTWLRFSLVQPMDQTREYDTTIAMLGMDIGDTVELTNQEYRNYVLDQWSWSNMWATSNSEYVGTENKTLLLKYQNPED